ncbi:MAG: tetratricopeptide repeat protein [Treponema sp.]|nr:tetratricopeptide repeat protein [Treponema sp.]
MIKKDTLIAIASIIIIVSVLVLFYRFQRDADRREMASGIVAAGGGVPQTVEELMEAIDLYGRRIERHVEDAAQVGVYWKILGSRLASRGLHRHAVGAFEQAIYFTPEDQTLFFMTGQSAAIVAGSIVDFPGADPAERGEFLALAESSFLRAIAMDPVFGRPRLSLGILYVFDLDRPQDAIPQLERYLNISPQDTTAMFVLARAHFVTGGFREAVELYERVLAVSRDQEIRAEAEANIATVMEFLDG